MLARMTARNKLRERYGLFGLLVSTMFADKKNLKNNDSAALSNIGVMALTVVGVIIGAVVSLLILAELMPTYSGAVANISDNFTSADWGDQTANSISPIFGLVVSLGGLFAIVGLAFVAFRLSRRGG